MDQVVKIIEKLKKINGLKNDTALAKYLGINPSTLAGWKARNTIDYDLIFSKFNNISCDWLLHGIGEPFLDKKNKLTDVEPLEVKIKNLEKQLNEKEIELKKIDSELPSRYTSNVSADFDISEELLDYYKTRTEILETLVLKMSAKHIHKSKKG